MYLQATKQIQEEQQVLQCMIVNVADAPAHALTQLSLGGLTCVSNKMIKSGGDLLLEFTKVCGTTCKLKQGIPLLSNKVVASDKLRKCFEDCFKSLEIADIVSEKVISSMFTEVSEKIVNAIYI